MAKTQSNSNLILSPESIFTASSILWFGAQQQTKQQLSNVLFANDTTITPNYSCRSYQELSPTPQPILAKIKSWFNKTTQFHQANHLWIQDNYPVKTHYQQQLKHCFNTQITPTNFTNPTAAARTIQYWLTSQAHGIMNPKFDASNITNKTRLILIDTLYFNGRWQHQFDKNNNTTNDFYDDSGVLIKKNVVMMNDFFDYSRNEQTQTPHYGYTENKQWKVLSKPYLNSALSMIIFLPSWQAYWDPQTRTFLQQAQHSSLAQQLTELDINTFNQLIQEALMPVAGGLDRGFIDISLPKFSIQYNFNVIPYLQQLGVQDVFIDTAANLTAIAPHSNTDNLYVNLIQQQAKIEVDEQGTKNFTVGIDTVKWGSLGTSFFKANHPFMYLIYDRNRQQILFIGQYTNPNE